MTIRGILIGFNIADGESLGKLVTDYGYSKPTKEDPCARARIVIKGVEAGQVEVERKEQSAYATLTVPDFHDAAYAVQEVLKEFHGAGLLA